LWPAQTSTAIDVCHPSTHLRLEDGRDVPQRVCAAVVWPYPSDRTVPRLAVKATIESDGVVCCRVQIDQATHDLRWHEAGLQREVGSCG